jgi:hypothetical protein
MMMMMSDNDNDDDAINDDDDDDDVDDHKEEKEEEEEDDDDDIIFIHHSFNSRESFLRFSVLNVSGCLIQSLNYQYYPGTHTCLRLDTTTGAYSRQNSLVSWF